MLTDSTTVVNEYHWVIRGAHNVFKGKLVIELSLYLRFLKQNPNNPNPVD